MDLKEALLRVDLTEGRIEEVVIITGQRNKEVVSVISGLTGSQVAQITMGRRY